MPDTIKPKARRRSPARPCPECGRIHKVVGPASTWGRWADQRISLTPPPDAGSRKGVAR